MLEKIGRKRWNRRLRHVLDIIERVILPDVLYLGGGNARHIRGDLPVKARLVANDTGITGGIALWTRDDAALGREGGMD